MRLENNAGGRDWKFRQEMNEIVDLYKAAGLGIVTTALH